MCMLCEEKTEEGIVVQNERYCVKCRTYMSVACFTQEDGSTHATICDRHEPYKKGLRFCRGCNDYIALDLFPTGSLAYACRKHMKLHGGSQKAKKKQMENPDTKRRTLQWRMCYNDGKIFKHLLPRMGQAEIEIEIRKVDTKGILQLAVMPVDVKQKTSPQNVVVVTLQQRKELLKIVKARDFDEYTRIITAIQESYQ